MKTKGKVTLMTGASLIGMGIMAVEMSEKIPPNKAIYLSTQKICSGINLAMDYLESSQTTEWTGYNFFNLITDSVNPEEYKLIILDNIPDIVRRVRWEYRTDTVTGVANKVVELLNYFAVYVTSAGSDIVMLTSEDYENRFGEAELEIIERVNHTVGKISDSIYFYVSGGLLKIK